LSFSTTSSLWGNRLSGCRVLDVGGSVLSIDTRIGSAIFRGPWRKTSRPRKGSNYSIGRDDPSDPIVSTPRKGRWRCTRSRIPTRRQSISSAMPFSRPAVLEEALDPGHCYSLTPFFWPAMSNCWTASQASARNASKSPTVSAGIPIRAFLRSRPPSCARETAGRRSN
jgi:hypothetical protein